MTLKPKPLVIISSIIVCLLFTSCKTQEASLLRREQESKRLAKNNFKYLNTSYDKLKKRDTLYVVQDDTDNLLKIFKNERELRRILLPIFRIGTPPREEDIKIYNTFFSKKKVQHYIKQLETADYSVVDKSIQTDTERLYPKDADWGYRFNKDIVYMSKPVFIKDFKYAFFLLSKVTSYSSLIIYKKNKKGKWEPYRTYLIDIS